MADAKTPNMTSARHHVGNKRVSIVRDLFVSAALASEFIDLNLREENTAVVQFGDLNSKCEA